MMSLTACMTVLLALVARQAAAIVRDGRGERNGRTARPASGATATPVASAGSRVMGSNEVGVEDREVLGKVVLIPGA